MQITYLGHSCFKIKTKEITILTDPYDSYLGFAMPKAEAKIVTVSHDHKDHSYTKAVEGSPFIIQAPGEYEIANISIFGTRTYHDQAKGKERGLNTIYTIRIEETSLCHLGDLGHKLTDKQLEEVNGVDVLFIPVGGIYTLDPKEAMEVISQIEPKIVIPMHYKTKDHHAKAFGQLATLDDFLKEAGAPEVKKEAKLVVSKASLPEETEIFCLLRK